MGLTDVTPISIIIATLLIFRGKYKTTKIHKLSVNRYDQSRYDQYKMAATRNCRKINSRFMPKLTKIESIPGVTYVGKVSKNTESALYGCIGFIFRTG